MSSEPSTRRWWIAGAVVAWLVNPVCGLMAADSNGLLRNCPPGPSDIPQGCPREGLSGILMVLALAGWILVTLVAAAVLGGYEGHHRRFVGGNVVWAVLVTLAAPWTMMIYALSYGVALLFPPAQVAAPVPYPKS